MSGDAVPTPRCPFFEQTHSKAFTSLHHSMYPLHPPSSKGNPTLFPCTAPLPPSPSHSACDYSKDIFNAYDKELLFITCMRRTMKMTGGSGKLHSARFILSCTLSGRHSALVCMTRVLRFVFQWLSCTRIGDFLYTYRD